MTTTSDDPEIFELGSSLHNTLLDYHLKMLGQIEKSHISDLSEI